MSAAPERIWVAFQSPDSISEHRVYDDDVEYVRADLYEELRDLLEEASRMMVADVVGYTERNTINNWVTRANDRSNT